VLHLLNGDATAAVFAESAVVVNVDGGSLMRAELDISPLGLPSWPAPSTSSASSR
jgi:hypothetical protein